MLVFLSWSGLRSKAVAETLQLWLAEAIQVIEPWMSTDIDKGARWAGELSSKLERSKVAIVCLTPLSLNSHWVYFEAGALSKTKDALVCNLLVGLASSAVTYPLAQFQSTSTSKEDIRKLLQSINKAIIQSGEPGLKEAVFERVFDSNWPRLETALVEIQNRVYQDESQQRTQEPLDMMEEMIGVALLGAPEFGLGSDEVAIRTLRAMSASNATPPSPQVLALLAVQLESKQLKKLTNYGYVEQRQRLFRLTDEGRSYFVKAADRISDLKRRLEGM